MAIHSMKRLATSLRRGERTYDKGNRSHRVSMILLPSLCTLGVAERVGDRVLFGLWLLTLFAPSWAFAAMPPWVYQQARETAMYHVQVKVLHVEGPSQTPGECPLTGEVVRIFHDTTGRLQPGSTLVFTVSCRKGSDTHVPIGGTLWTDYDSLMQATYIKVFLNSDDHGYQVALWQLRIIEGPTMQPIIRRGSGG